MKVKTPEFVPKPPLPKKEMTVMEYLREKARMTKNCQINCADCPLSESKNGLYGCNTFEAYYPEKAIKIVQNWAEEHPAKTILDDFLEKFPKAKETRYYGKHPDFCVRKLGYTVRESCFDEDGEFDCSKCWSRPLGVE